MVLESSEPLQTTTLLLAIGILQIAYGSVRLITKLLLHPVYGLLLELTGAVTDHLCPVGR
jgi:hypothetical protein